MPETGHLVPYKQIFLLIFLFFVLASTSFSQTYPDSTADSLIKTGIYQLISQDYDNSLNTFKQLDEKYSDLPLGNIYSAAVEIAKGYDYGDGYDANLIDTEFNKAEKKVSNLLDKDDANVWYIYFDGLLKGYSAYFYILENNWISAFSDGFDSFKDFSKCLNLDSTFYDAYAAIGTFEYWKSAKTGFLNWLPFVDDDRQEGIRYLKISIAHSSYNSYLAMNSLIWIYINEKDFESAKNTAESALKEFPNSRFFMWGLARVYEELDKRKAIEIYDEILNSLKNINRLSLNNEVLLKHLIAQQYYKIGENDKALNLCNEILSIKDIEESNDNDVSSRIRRVKELKEKILNQ
jgi:Tetratricopeptide repeat